MSATGYSQIPGSYNAPPVGAVKQVATPQGDQLTVSIYVKTQSTDPLLQKPSTGAVTDRTVVAQRRVAIYTPILDLIENFATSAGLQVVEKDPERRLIKLAGTIGALSSAFQTTIDRYDLGYETFYIPASALSVPQQIVSEIEGVLGLDTRPVARPTIARRSLAATTSYRPDQVSKLYDFPATPGMGKGETIGILEFGGGYSDNDVALAFERMGLSPPTMVSVPVDGQENNPGTDDDGEVALDIQIAGGAAPGAKLAVYFAPSTFQGWADCISLATKNRVSVMSISWGGDEGSWGEQAIRVISGIIADSARINIPVFASSGDWYATDGINDRRAHVLYPASDPNVVGCGGTSITTDGTSITHESAWPPGGGGISDVFGPVDYQANAHIPPSVNAGRIGRGVPDLAADSDPNTGYQIVLHGYLYS
jgi:kumamolisin